MYLALQRETIQNDYREAARRIEEKFHIKPIRTDCIVLKPAVMEGLTDDTGIVCVYGAPVLPPFRSWLRRQSDITLLAHGVPYRTQGMKVATHDVERRFGTDIIVYGRTGDLGRKEETGRSSLDDDMLLRNFGIRGHNIRNLLRVGQNGSFKEDGLYMILINEELAREAFIRQEMRLGTKTA